MLNNLDSSTKRYSVYEKCKKLPFLKPEEVVLGIRHVTINNVVTEKQKIGYYIPFLKYLNMLLQLPEVWNCIQNPHYSANEFMYDICDGEYVRSNPLFKKKTHLQIILNTDDIEIVNPLGTHIKHTNFQCFITQLQIFHPSIGLNCMLSSYWRLHLCYIILSTRRNYSHSSGLTIKSDHLNLAICIKKSIRGQFWKRRC